ncbi:MAG: YggT family protein [Candidatus Omnitrophica bacterium]|nr:YggT family protein [Candidatus Omnitrophota bacterium]
MFILGEFFGAMAILVSGICQILYWALFLRILLSWLPVDPYNNFVQLLTQVTDPLLAPFRRLPLQIGMLDISPILAFVALFFLRNVLVRIFLGLAQQFGAAY